MPRWLAPDMDKATRINTHKTDPRSIILRSVNASLAYMKFSFAVSLRLSVAASLLEPTMKTSFTTQCALSLLHAALFLTHHLHCLIRNCVWYVSIKQGTL